MPQLILLGIALAASIAELILSLRWSPAYFRNAIPLYRKRLPGLSGLPPGIEERLETFFEHRNTRWRLLFRRLSAEEIAFRNGFSFWRSSAPMYGLIRRVPEEGVVYVTGYLHWWTLPVVVCWSAFFVRAEFDPSFLLVIALFLAGLGIQASRYRSVAAGYSVSSAS